MTQRSPHGNLRKPIIPAIARNPGRRAAAQGSPPAPDRLERSIGLPLSRADDACSNPIQYAHNSQSFHPTPQQIKPYTNDRKSQPFTLSLSKREGAAMKNTLRRAQGETKNASADRNLPPPYCLFPAPTHPPTSRTKRSEDPGPSPAFPAANPGPWPSAPQRLRSDGKMELTMRPPTSRMERSGNPGPRMPASTPGPLPAAAHRPGKMATAGDSGCGARHHRSSMQAGMTNHAI